MRQLKGSLQPALHMDLIDHTLLSSDSIEIPGVNYNTTIPLMSLYWSPPVQLTYLEERQPRDALRKAVKQEKSNNTRGAISSVPEISHPLHRELATVRTRLTAVERNAP